jgi:NAD(P)-dependent dehydrogenase (short-subunit alcohol dehydrogenase family)
MSGRLQGKVCVITGATSGIGEATARRFATEGASVVLAGRNADKGRALVEQLGGRSRFSACDVRHEAQIAALLDFAIAEFGRVDSLFNNAGGTNGSELTTVTEVQFDQTMRLLVGSVVFGIKHAARVMGPAGGSIINNSSVAAHRTGQGDILYSAAKAAVSHLTRLAGVQLGPRGIRVNAISPGAIATPIFWGGSQRAATLSDEENAKKLQRLSDNLARATPTPRSGVADDIAAAAVYLASDEGSYVNCHDLVVDGGRTSAFWERSAK